MISYLKSCWIVPLILFQIALAPELICPDISKPDYGDYGALVEKFVTDTYQLMADGGGGTIIGNGGDPLRVKFAKAKNDAAALVLRLSNQMSASTGENTPGLAWLIASREVLGADIIQSQHLWIPGEQATCGLTLLKRNVPIRFSFPQCSKFTQTREDIIFILIHESLHHLGIEEEAQADSLANLIMDLWRTGQLDHVPLPQIPLKPRSYAASAYNTDSIIIWGGTDQEGAQKDGAIYNREQQKWKKITRAPQARVRSIGFLVGEEFYAWGGYRVNTSQDIIEKYWVPSALKYDLKTRKWKEIVRPTMQSELSFSEMQTTVFTGKEFLIWGGDNGSAVSGFRYNPFTKEFGTIAAEDAPLRQGGHVAAWSGQEMLVWGGLDSEGNSTNAGALYNPLLDKWTQVSGINAPPYRQGASALWCDDSFVIIGGTQQVPGDSAGIYVYDPQKDLWSQIDLDLLLDVTENQAVWTGSDILMMGGATSRHMKFPKNPLLIDPIRKRADLLYQKGLSSQRLGATLVWLEDRGFLFGGKNPEGIFFNDSYFIFPY